MSASDINISKFEREIIAPRNVPPYQAPDNLIQDLEIDIAWYKDNFFDQDHTHYLALDSLVGPCIISLLRAKCKKNQNLLYLIIRHDKGCERYELPADKIPRAWYRRLFGMQPSLYEILVAIEHPLAAESLSSFFERKDLKMQKDIVTMEERQVIRSYKFGILYVAPGQSSEEEALANNLNPASPKFERFLEFIGEQVSLKGWRNYRGGLDVHENQTGTVSYYTKWKGFEIMYHVAPLLPYRQGDTQQLERKRHVGNDILIVLFNESEKPFQMSSITSKQNHVIIEIRPKNQGFEMHSFYKKGVPSFKPSIPSHNYFEYDESSRNFFLQKCILGERASYKSPDFAPKIARTRAVLLYDLAERYI